MFITVKNSSAICQFLVYNSTTYSNIVQGVYLEEFTTVYSFSYIVVLLLFYWNMQQSPCEISKLLHCPLCCSLWNYFEKKIIKDRWFIIYAMIHVFNWKMCLLDHSKIIHPLFSPSLIWQLDLNNTLKQMALEAKKNVQRWNRDFGNFDSSYCTLLLKNCPSTYFVNNSLIRRERYIYLIYIFKLQSFEIYMGVGVCVRVCVYIYIIDR